MLFGMAAILLWGGLRLLDAVPVPGRGRQHVVLLWLVVLGTTFTVAGELLASDALGASALGLFAMGRFVEGGAAVRGLRKLAYVLRHRSFPGGAGGLKKKARYVAIRAAVGLVTTGALYGLLVAGGLDAPLVLLTLAWTLGTFTMAILGLSWKLGSAEEQLSPSIIVGLLVAFGGATVFDYVNLLMDVTALLVGTGAFIGGVVLGAVAVAME